MQRLFFIMLINLFGWWCTARVKEAPGVWGNGEMGGWVDGEMGSVGEIKKYISSPLPCRTTPD